MYLRRWGRDGLRLYRLHWNAGPNILRLPAILRPAAILGRNLRDVCRFYLTAPRRERRHALPSQEEVFRNLVMGVEYVHFAGVEGDLAEFGTMTGSSALVLSRSLAWFHELARTEEHRTDRRMLPRRLHLFDSFLGLPAAESEIDRNSPHVQSGVWGPGTCRGLTANELKRECSRFLAPPAIHIYQGWFKDTLPRVPESTRFALIHIDADLYESARDVLEEIFSRGLLAPGAAVFFDDWNPNRASPDQGERRAWSEAVARHQVTFSDWGSYGWGGQKFIVHSYMTSR